MHESTTGDGGIGIDIQKCPHFREGGRSAQIRAYLTSCIVEFRLHLFVFIGYLVSPLATLGAPERLEMPVSSLD